MTKIQKLKIIILLSALFFILSSPSVFAAELFLEAKNQEVALGEQFILSAFLNTTEESINAAEGRVLFPENLLEVKEIRDGNSIINFWIERPRIEQAGAIGFSGIIPGGYQETKGFLFSVVFRAKASGNGAIEIREAKVLLNDGEGTQASLSISNFQFLISKQIPISQVPISEITDTDPPESFEPVIGQDPEMFEGKYFLVFLTQDKGSGIDHYEILESRIKNYELRILRWKLRLKNWETAESPYVLKDQKLRSYIYVKAIDKAGNERIAIVEPRYPLKWYEQPLIWIIIILGVLILYIIGKILWQRFIKSR